MHSNIQRQVCTNSKQMTIVVAMTAERIIGRRGQLPWSIPEDLALFRRLTYGHTLVMGRRTFESIGRPLPGRFNIVVSRSMPPVEGLRVCRHFAEALQVADQGNGDIFFIGGCEIYRQALAVAGKLSVSWIRKNYPGDCRFPEYRSDDWLIEQEQDYSEFRHIIYRRR